MVVARGLAEEGMGVTFSWVQSLVWEVLEMDDRDGCTTKCVTELHI